MSERRTDKLTDRQTDRHTDRKTDRLFSLVIKTKVFQNVNRMSKIQSDRQEDIQFARQTDKVTERQNDSMADSRAAKEPALVFGINTTDVRVGGVIIIMAPINRTPRASS